MRAAVIALATIATVVTACGLTASLAAPPVLGSPAPAVPTASGPIATTAASSAASPSGGPSSGPAASFDPTGQTVQATVAVTGFSAPLDVTNAGDGSGRLFVVEQGGRDPGRHGRGDLDPPFLDISDRITSGGERGLLGLTFHPDYPTDPRFFVDYTDRDGNTVVAAYTVSATDPNVADASSEKVLLQIEQPFANHNGGAVEFGPGRHALRGDGRRRLGGRSPRRGTASASTRSWPRSCGSTSPGPAPIASPTGSPPTTSVRCGHRRGPKPRDLAHGAAQPVAGRASPGPPATSGSATSARARGRRSTWRGPGRGD